MRASKTAFLLGGWGKLIEPLGKYNIPRDRWLRQRIDFFNQASGQETSIAPELQFQSLG